METVSDILTRAGLTNRSAAVGIGNEISTGNIFNKNHPSNQVFTRTRRKEILSNVLDEMRSDRFASQSSTYDLKKMIRRKNIEARPVSQKTLDLLKMFSDDVIKTQVASGNPSVQSGKIRGFVNGMVEKYGDDAVNVLGRFAKYGASGLKLLGDIAGAAGGPLTIAELSGYLIDEQNSGGALQGMSAGQEAAEREREAEQMYINEARKQYPNESNFNIQGIARQMRSEIESQPKTEPQWRAR